MRKTSRAETERAKERDETRLRQRVERTRSPPPLLLDYQRHFEIYNWKCNNPAKPRATAAARRHFDIPPSLPPSLPGFCVGEIGSAIFIFPQFFAPSFVPSFPHSPPFTSDPITLCGRSVGRDFGKEGRKEGRKAGSNFQASH